MFIEFVGHQISETMFLSFYYRYIYTVKKKSHSVHSNSKHKLIQKKNTGEKVGGGIQVLFPKNKNFELKNIKNENKEILDIEGKMHGIDMKLVVAYFDVDKGESGRDNYKKIRKDLEK